MRWSDVDAVLNSFAMLSTSVAAIVVALVAVLGYRKWHVESIGKRKIELAEDILADFYRMKETIDWARNPGGLEGEGESRPSKAIEDPSEKSFKNSIYRTIERLQEDAEVFSRLQSRKHRAMAYFGKEAAQPFDDLRLVHGQVYLAASTMIRTFSKADTLPEDWNKWQVTIGWRPPPDGNDQIAIYVDDLIERVENFYGRWLMRKTSPDRTTDP